MSEDRKLLPAMRESSDIARRLDGASQAATVDDPITGFFHGIASRARTRALDYNSAETRAFQRNVEAQAGAVRAMLDLRDAIDDYRVRDELADDMYRARRELAQSKLSDQREQALRVRQRARADADYRDQIAIANNEAALERARDFALRAQQSREFTQAIKDLKTERGEHIFTAGLRDAEGHRLTAEEVLARRRAALGGVLEEPQPKQDVSEAIATLEDELRNLQARGASAAEIGTLYNAIARLKAVRET